MVDRAKQMMKNFYARCIISWCFIILPCVFLIAGWFGLEADIIKHTKEYMMSIFAAGGLAAFVEYWLNRKNDKNP